MARTPGVALDHVAERVGDERVRPFLVESELDPTTLRRRQVHRLGVLPDDPVDRVRSNTVPITWKADHWMGWR